MANNRKPPTPPLSPDAAEARRAVENLEREIVFGCISSYRFYQSIRESVAPWDPDRRSHRLDFSVDRYNSLWRFVAAFYQRFSHLTLDTDLFIPVPVLSNYVIDSANRNGIPLTIAEKLVDEIKEEAAFTKSLTLESLRALSQSTAFSDWLSGRVLEHAAGQIAAKKSLGILTLDSLEELTNSAKSAAGLSRSDSIVQGASFVRSKRLILPMISFDDPFPILCKMLGGGFYWGDSSMLAAINSGGKCLGKDTPVMMYTGRVKPVQDIQVGDLLMGPDSRPRRVLSLARGREEMFRVKPIKGDAWECNRSHILSLQAGGDCSIYKKGQVVELSVDEYLKKPNWWKLLFKQYRTGVDFKATDVPFDPYVVGLWLGNGSRHGSCITVGHHNPEIRSYLYEWAGKNGMSIRVEAGHGCDMLHFRKTAFDGGKCQMREIAKLCQNHGQKRVPVQYLKNCESVRLQLLAGLLDTDGYMHHCNYELVSVYPKLADQIVYLARSLGFAAYMSDKVGTIKSSNFVGHYKRITMSGTLHRVPVKVGYKKCSDRAGAKLIKSALRVGFEVESIGEGDYYGFEIDGDRRFLLGDFTVTHNTVCICQLADAFARAGYKTAVYTTERRPDELFIRSVSNRLNIELTRLTSTAGMASGVEAEVDFIPEFIWRDPGATEALLRMESEYRENLCYVDWSKGQGNNIKTHFDTSVQQMEALGFVPQVILFDWVGGGLDSMANKEWLRLYYQEAADHLINHAKRKRRIMIMAAQLDKSKVAPGTTYVDASMLSECKTMSNNLTNFIGITALRDKETRTGQQSVIRNMQKFCVGKATRGITGAQIDIELCFKFQRIAEVKTARKAIGGG